MLKWKAEQKEEKRKKKDEKRKEKDEENEEKDCEESNDCGDDCGGDCQQGGEGQRNGGWGNGNYRGGENGRFVGWNNGGGLNSVQCFNCGLYGHKKYQCRNPPNPNMQHHQPYQLQQPPSQPAYPIIPNQYPYTHPSRLPLQYYPPAVPPSAPSSGGVSPSSGAPSSSGGAPPSHGNFLIRGMQPQTKLCCPLCDSSGIPLDMLDHDLSDCPMLDRLNRQAAREEKSQGSFFICPVNEGNKWNPVGMFGEDEREIEKKEMRVRESKWDMNNNICLSNVVGNVGVENVISSSTSVIVKSEGKRDRVGKIDRGGENISLSSSSLNLSGKGEGSSSSSSMLKVVGGPEWLASRPYYNFVEENVEVGVVHDLSVESKKGEEVGDESSEDVDVRKRDCVDDCFVFCPMIVKEKNEVLLSECVSSEEFVPLDDNYVVGNDKIETEIVEGKEEVSSMGEEGIISSISSEGNSVDMGFEVNSFADFGLIDLGNCFNFPSCELLWVNLCEIREGLSDSSSSFDELNGVLIDYFVKDLAIIWGKELCGSKFIVGERDVIDFLIYFIDLLLLICYLVRNYRDNRICLESSSFVFDPGGVFRL